MGSLSGRNRDFSLCPVPGSPRMITLRTLPRVTVLESLKGLCHGSPVHFV